MFTVLLFMPFVPMPLFTIQSIKKITKNSSKYFTWNSLNECMNIRKCVSVCARARDIYLKFQKINLSLFHLLTCLFTVKNFTTSAHIKLAIICFAIFIRISYLCWSWNVWKKNYSKIRRRKKVFECAKQRILNCRKTFN